MKNLFALMLVALPLIGCTVNAPPATSSTTYTTPDAGSSSTTVTRSNY